MASDTVESYCIDKGRIADMVTENECNFFLFNI